MILYMDRYHSGDMLFLQAFVRAMAARPSSLSLMVYHGAGEPVERLFEQEGLFPERVGGVFTPSEPRERMLLERGMRESARKLSALLTDTIVPAVPLMGCDRNLLTTDAGGNVRVGNVAWLRDLLEKKAVPVVAGLARRADANEVEEVAPAPAMAQLVGALSLRGVALFPKGGRIPELEAGTRTLAWDPQDANGLVAEPDVATQILAAGVSVQVVTPDLLRTTSPLEWPYLKG